MNILLVLAGLILLLRLQILDKSGIHFDFCSYLYRNYKIYRLFVEVHADTVSTYFFFLVWPDFFAPFVLACDL